MGATLEILLKDMITYKATVEEAEKSIKSTRKSEIKKWAKKEINNGAECVDVYAYYKSPCANSLGQPSMSYVGSFYKDGEITFK